MGQQPQLIVELGLHRHNTHKTWRDIAKHAGQVTDSQPRNSVSASPPPLPKAEPRPTAEAEVRSTPDQTRADRPILKPKATTVTTGDALRPLPTLGRRPTPEAQVRQSTRQAYCGFNRGPATSARQSQPSSLRLIRGRGWCRILSADGSRPARRRELLPSPLRRCRIKFGGMGSMRRLPVRFSPTATSAARSPRHLML